MKTATRRAQQPSPSVDTLASSEQGKSSQQAAKKTGSWAAPHKNLGRLLSNLAAARWCRQSSADLNEGLTASEVPADTVPDELRDELFKR